MEVLLRSVACCLLPRTNYHVSTCACLLTYPRNPLIHIIGCVFSIRSTDQWIDLFSRIYRRSRFISYLLIIINNITQRVDNTIRLLIRLGVCIFLSYLIERADVIPLTAHAFAYAVKHKRRVYYYEILSLDQSFSLNYRLYYESSSCLDYSIPS
jgi:hypothetical protein